MMNSPTDESSLKVLVWLWPRVHQDLSINDPYDDLIKY